MDGELDKLKQRSQVIQGFVYVKISLTPFPARPRGVPEVQTEGIHQQTESRGSQGFASC